MTCPTCGAENSPTAKFCDQCGTRAHDRRAIDDEHTHQLGVQAKGGYTRACLSGLGENEAWYVAGKDVLAKARELLCGPKDAEIARLKAELDESRTAAANARREALDEVIVMAVSNEQQERNRYWKEAHRCLIAHATELRDASQPAAETQTPKLCGAYYAEFGATCLLPRGHKGMHAADGLWWPNGDAREMCEHGRCGKSGWMVRDGRAVVCTCVVPRPLAQPVEQPPARDVEGLARVLEKAWLGSDCKTFHDIAEVVFAHLDGGPST